MNDTRHTVSASAFDLQRRALECAPCNGTGCIWGPGTARVCSECEAIRAEARDACDPFDVMSLQTEPGQKVVFANALNGYSDKRVLKSLELGREYTVRRVDVFDSRSHVYLEEVAGGFNSVLFKNMAPLSDDQRLGDGK